jgi:hypothetical protein
MYWFQFDEVVFNNCPMDVKKEHIWALAQLPPSAIMHSALDADERNFHAWHYRQFVVRLMKRPLQEELLYSEDRVGVLAPCAVCMALV